MSSQRATGGSDARGQTLSDAEHITGLVKDLARVLLSGQGGRIEPGAAPSETHVNAVVRLCVRILTSQIGEPLISGDEASIALSIRTRLVKAPSSAGNGIDTALKFQELHNRLRLLNFVKKRGPMLHLLNAFMGTGTVERRPSTGTAQLLPQLFTEPAAALSGSERVTRPRSTPAVLPSEAHHYGESNGITREQRRAHTVGRTGGSGRARAVNEVTERALLRGILYAFQGIDSQYIKYCQEESGYVIDPRLRLGRSQREIVSRMLEMGWLFNTVVTYIQRIEGGTDDLGPSRTQQAFVFSLKQDMTEYYRLIAVLGAQLNLDSERAGEGKPEGATEGLTLKRLAVWVVDPMERLKQMATLVSAAAKLKGGALATCLHTHMEHGNPLVRGLVQRTMVRACEPLFSMIKTWVFEGELLDLNEGFFIRTDPCAQDEMLWQERYRLNVSLLPNFIDPGVASKILTIGKSINFLRRLCGDSEWIMGPMAKAAAETKTLEYGNTASLREAVDSCATLTNARLVHLIMEQYQLKSHLRILKKFLLHGQGDVMLALVEALGPELDKMAQKLFKHNLTGIVDGVIKNSTIMQEESENLSRIKTRMFTGNESDSGWDVFSLDYEVGSPVSSIVTSQAITCYRRVFFLLWRIKRVEWSLASAWRLQTSATHIRLERTLPELRGALHRCSLIRGQMFFLTTNLSNYMMFEVLETSWGTLQETLDSALTLDDIIQAHNKYLSDVMVRALLHEGSDHVSTKLIEVEYRRGVAVLSDRSVGDKVLSIIVDFCSQHESLIVRAMAEATAQRVEQLAIENERRHPARGQWGVEAQSAGGRQHLGRDPFGMSSIEDTALRYEDTLSDLVRLLEGQSVKTEMLQYLTFRLDFNDYYKDRQAQVTPPPVLRRGDALLRGSSSSRPLR